MAVQQRTTSIVSEEELQLRKRARRRLVGAIALVLVAVIVLPLVLDQEPGQQPRNVQVEMPAPPVPPGATAPPATGADPQAPMADSQAQATQSAAAPLPPPAAVPAPAPPTNPPAAAQAPQPPATASPAAPAQAPPAPVQARPFAVAPKPVQPSEFVIQLGAFGETARARGLEQRLKKAGFPVYLERVPQANRTRVRAGPYPSREAAERAYQQMKQRGLADPATVGQIVPRGQ